MIKDLNFQQSNKPLNYLNHSLNYIKKNQFPKMIKILITVINY